MLNRLSHRALDATQYVISSPNFFWLTIFVTIGWMSLNLVLVANHHKPLDPPEQFFPGLILAYSLVALWVENAMKVQMKQQQDMAQKQLDKIEDLAEVLVQGQQSAVNTLMTIQQMAEENEQRDELMQNIITIVDHTVDAVERTTDEILRLQKEEVTR